MLDTRDIITDTGDSPHLTDKHFGDNRYCNILYLADKNMSDTKYTTTDPTDAIYSIWPTNICQTQRHHHNYGQQKYRIACI